MGQSFGRSKRSSQEGTCRWSRETYGKPRKAQRLRMPLLWIPDVIPHLYHEYNPLTQLIPVWTFYAGVLMVMTGIFLDRVFRFLFSSYVAPFFPKFAKKRWVAQCLRCSTFTNPTQAAPSNQVN
jgi:hypothetical protein